MYRILIADDEPIVRMDLSLMLKELGYDVIGEADDGFDALELCRALRPDIVLMDIKMPVFDGLSAAERILSADLCRCVILLTAFNDGELIERAAGIGVAAYLVKPIEQRLLKPTIEVALAQSRRLKESRRETEEAKRKLEESRLIARAQGVLAKRENITEAEAYQLLRRLSMNKRTSMAELAQVLTETEDTAGRRKKPGAKRGE